MITKSKHLFSQNKQLYICNGYAAKFIHHKLNMFKGVTFYLNNLLDFILQINPAALSGRIGELFCPIREWTQHHHWSSVRIRIGHCSFDRFQFDHCSSTVDVRIQNGLQTARGLQWIDLSEIVTFVEIVNWRRSKWPNREFAVEWFSQIRFRFDFFARYLERAVAGAALFNCHLHGNWRRWNYRFGVFIRFYSIAR